MSEPLVSVVMPSFNHDRFIADSISSVLSQTESDLELIIVDDGSSDQSREIISSVADARVRHRFFLTNLGACAAMNAAIGMSRGRYIAVCNSDDQWVPEKLSQQLQLLTKHDDVSAVFTDVVWIDERGEPIRKDQLPYFSNIFRQPNRSRSLWLRDLLERGNCLCHPSVLLKRETYDRAGLYDNRLRQLPDLDMWLRVVLTSQIFVSAEQLTRFRIHPHNTSRPSEPVSCRSINEHQLILEKIMSKVPASEFIRAFGTRLEVLADEIDLAIEKALYLLAYQGAHDVMFRNYGLRLLFEIMEEGAGLERLASRYNFFVDDFYREMACNSPWLPTTPSSPIAETHTIDLVKVVSRRLGFRSKLLLSAWKQRFWPRRS